MEFHVRSVDLPVNDDLRAFAERRADKLDRFFDRPADAQLELAPPAPAPRRRTSSAVQFTIQAGRAVLRAEETTTTPTRRRSRLRQAAAPGAELPRSPHRSPVARQPHHRFDGAEPHGLAPEQMDFDWTTAPTDDDEPRHRPHQALLPQADGARTKRSTRWSCSATPSSSS